MLSIKNLKASIEDGTQILKGINLEVKPGEVHAIMGPIWSRTVLPTRGGATMSPR